MREEILTFKLSGNLLGINVTLVREVNRNIEYTPVPGAQDHIVGFFNMRGQVVTLFDLTRLLGLKGKSEQTELMSIILKKPSDPNLVGFLIDIPGDVIEIDREECEIPPPNVEVIKSEYIDSVVKLQDELMILIDPVRIFNDSSNLEE